MGSMSNSLSGDLTHDDITRTGMFTERYRKWLDEDPARVRAELDDLLTRLRREEEAAKP